MGWLGVVSSSGSTVLIPCTSAALYNPPHILPAAQRGQTTWGVCACTPYRPAPQANSAFRKPFPGPSSPTPIMAGSPLPPFQEDPGGPGSALRALGT